MTDFEILQIPQTDDLERVKKAYRTLVKKIHPDIGNMEFKNHLLFIEVHNAYRRIIHKVTLREEKLPVVEDSKTDIKEKNQDYEFYKKGIDEIKKIHPSFWLRDIEAVMSVPGVKNQDELKKIRVKVDALLKCLPVAYYYFSVVVNEYKESVWAADSGERLIQIEKYSLLYKKISESITEHAVVKPKVNRMFGIH